MCQNHMSYEEADILLYYLESFEPVSSAKVYDRTADAVICYTGNPDIIIDRLRRFHYEDIKVPNGYLERSGRETNAMYQEKLIDKIIMVITTAFVSMPSFIAGALLLTIFAVSLHLLPANGAQKNGLILPVVTLGLYPMAYITRLTRSSMLDVLGQDYIRTARAKGVPGFKVIFGHALKNSLIPVITYFGPMLAYIVTGSIVVEQIFAVPGIGRAFVNSITGRDYPLIMGTTIILACLIIIMNLVSDLLYKIVDPRIELD